MTRTHNMQIFGEIPFVTPQGDTLRLKTMKNERETYLFGGVELLFACPVLGRFLQLPLWFKNGTKYSDLISGLITHCLTEPRTFVSTCMVIDPEELSG